MTATKTIRLSAEDVRTIRREVEREGKRNSRAGRFVLEIGIRHGDADLGVSINVLAVSRDPSGEWNDTDLYDKAPWSDVRKPIPLTAEGRAVLDFYVYEWERGEVGDLVCNAQAEIDSAGLVAIHADSDKDRWRRA